MMQDAREGKFDVIYTKSISRFGRNTVHLLESVRELRDLGIAVIFQNENINTLSNTSELFMTIAAALAESELEEDSKRQRWSYQDRFQNGWISIGTGMYGYRMVKDNQLEIVEDEAAVVREIYAMYLSGMGTIAISNVLNDRGLKTSRGNPWGTNSILEIISKVILPYFIWVKLRLSSTMKRSCIRNKPAFVWYNGKRFGGPGSAILRNQRRPRFLHTNDGHAKESGLFR